LESIAAKNKKKYGHIMKNALLAIKKSDYEQPVAGKRG
jgi:hypothetical protein